MTFSPSLSVFVYVIRRSSTRACWLIQCFSFLHSLIHHQQQLLFILIIFFCREDNSFAHNTDSLLWIFLENIFEPTILYLTFTLWTGYRCDKQSHRGSFQRPQVCILFYCGRKLEPHTDVRRTYKLLQTYKHVSLMSTARTGHTKPWQGLHCGVLFFSHMQARNMNIRLTGPVNKLFPLCSISSWCPLIFYFWLVFTYFG